MDVRESITTEVDSQENLGLRHAQLMGGCSFAHTLICTVYFVQGYFSTGWAEFLVLFSVIWLGNLVFYYLLRSGKNYYFSDPGLTLQMITWSAISILASAYYADEFRLSVMMFYFGTMLLASFRVKTFAFGITAALTSLGYALVLYFVFKLKPEAISMTVEILQLAIFTIIAFSFAVTGGGISRLKRKIYDKDHEISLALDRIQELAIRDELTGLLNRRKIMSLISDQKAIADSGGYSFVVCFLDLDHFKNVNDKYGHATGDLVLKRYAQLSVESVRDIDYSARLGGEEFLLVLTKSKLEDGMLVANRIRIAVESCLFDDIAVDLKMTASVGVTAYVSGESVEDTLSRADHLLYQAKTAGRNQVVCSEGDRENGSSSPVEA